MIFADPAKIVPDVGTNGQRFTQLYHHIPFTEMFYTEYEKNWRAKAALDFADNNTMLPVYICIAYLIFIFGGREVLKNSKPFGLKNELAAWNLLLSLFSWCGAFRTVPHLLYIVSTQPYRDTICTPSDVQYGEGACGFWVMLFIYSKVPELVDTVFITLRKKKLIFLHWYHHVTVLLFCWHSYANRSSTGLYFVAMNYSVHAVMYGYFFLMAIDVNPGKFFPPVYITMAQITQMFVGVTVQISAYLYMKGGMQCDVRPENVLAGGIMYGSYLYLFAEFAVKRFILEPAKKKAAKAE